jgi:hypothetical protein
MLLFSKLFYFHIRKNVALSMAYHVTSIWYITKKKKKKQIQICIGLVFDPLLPVIDHQFKPSDMFTFIFELLMGLVQ